MFYYINGDFIKSSQAKIPFSDGGFLYGDGLFETMRFDNRKLFSPQKHIDRLFLGLDIIALQINKTKKELIKILNDVISKNNIHSGIIRLIMTRGNSDKSIGSINNPSIYISIKPFYSISASPVKVMYLEESGFPIIRFNPAIKSMNYLGNMLAKKYCDTLNIFEPIFYNKDNLITECAIRNIFYVKDSVLITPSLDLGILSGVMRDTILDIAKKLKIQTIETHINFNQINLMDESFITSTGIGLLPCYWEGWNSEYIITNQIKKELFNRIKNT